MRKFSFALAALATVSFAVPSIANAQDKPPMKEGMKGYGEKKPMMHHHHHYHHHYHHKMMTKKKYT